jgi:hypothetical protein
MSEPSLRTTAIAHARDSFGLHAPAVDAALEAGIAAGVDAAFSVIQRDAIAQARWRTQCSRRRRGVMSEPSLRDTLANIIIGAALMVGVVVFVGGPCAICALLGFEPTLGLIPAGVVIVVFYLWMIGEGTRHG